MKAIKISSFRRFFILSVLVLLILLTGCSCNIFEMFKVNTLPMDGGFTLSIDSQLLEHVPYENLPTYTLEYDGIVNVGENRTGEFEYALYRNDDYKISRIIEKLIQEYEEKGRITYKVVKVDTELETWMNTTKDGEDVQDYIKIKDEKVSNEMAYIALENGLILSFNYAKFSDFSGNTYYRWQKTENIRFVLHYPLMMYKNKETNVNEFVIMAIPNGVIYNYSTTTKKLDSILGNDKFLEAEWYTFNYANSYEENYQEYVDYYINNFNGRWENGKLRHEYLGYTFDIEFTEKNMVFSLVY